MPGHGVLVNAPKTSSGIRTVPLSSRMALELAARAGQPEDLVFPAMRGGYIDRPNYHGRMLKPAARRAGVAWVGFHTMRHTCASLLFASPEPDASGFCGGGKNVKQVQQWLGHATPAFTLERYIHLLDGGVGDADFFDGLA